VEQRLRWLHSLKMLLAPELPPRSMQCQVFQDH
jgi:hypothetical protein